MWWINRFCTACFDAVFSVMESWPGWLSLILLAGVTGVIALVAFRYTSNQDAIGQVRDDIKASLLAMKLYKDELSVTFKSQGRLFLSAVKLFLYSLQPLAVMIVPMVLLICQMGLRYEWKPLQPGDATLLEVHFKEGTPAEFRDVELIVPEGVEVETGPVRALQISKGKTKQEVRNAMVWKLRIKSPGLHEIVLQGPDAAVAKTIYAAGGDPYGKVSPKRAGQSFWDQLLFPAEKPAGADDLIQEVEVAYPVGSTPIWGMNVHWIITYFVASMVLALIIKPFLKVKI